jgi:uncharacterized protein involved in response to NO
MSDMAGRRGGIPRGISTTGPALLSYGFRPFFLGAGAFAPLAMLVWIGALSFGWEVGGATYGPLAWHAHEMLFGYTVAALAGFMLTAIPNWTGRLPVSGAPLLGLVLTWLAGRLAMLSPDLLGLYPAAIIDAVFLPLLAAVAGREIVAGRNWKNLKILIALAALSAVNLAFHALALTGGDTAVALRAAVAIFVVLVGLVGGRIIPSFTRNWLVKAGASSLPAPFGRFDMLAMLLLVVALTTWAVLPASLPAAALAGIAAALHALRLWRWRGIGTIDEPLVLVLHIAYLFIPVGLVGIVLEAMGLLSGPSVLHILTVGVIGLATLAVMTRASRGHTGHKLEASPTTSVSYLSLLLAAVLRPLAELLPTHYHLILEVAGTSWILAFSLFVAEYGPMLLRAKQK